MSFPKSKLICPACKKPTRRTRNGLCVHCKVPLELFQYTKDGEIFREFKLPEPEKAEDVIRSTKTGETITDLEGRMLTPEGSNPEIILLSKDKYKVTYRHDIPTDWVYCPNCHYRMFQNRVMNSVHLEQEFTCNRCRSVVVFVFSVGFSPIFTSPR